MIKKKQPKEKINIMGNKYKVEKPIADTLKALSDALHAHEVALLTYTEVDDELAMLAFAVKELREHS